MQNNKRIRRTKTGDIETELYPKQLLAFYLLESDVIEEVLFGGGAGGGKSYLGCVWLLLSAKKYPKSRWLMGRKIGSDLRTSTLLTFWEVCNDYGLVEGRDYIFKSQSGRIIFKNCSEIFLRQLKKDPSDPQFNRLGSTAYTGIFIDEAQEVDKAAYEVLKSRLRYRTKQFGIKGKILMACNPGKNFLYDDFYKPYVENRLPSNKAFIQALVEDNPSQSKDYIEKLENLDDESLKQKLRYGNWDYEDISNQLIPGAWFQNCLIDVYDHTQPKRLGVDFAREGGDRTCLTLYVGNVLADIKILSKIQPTDQTDYGSLIADEVIAYCEQHGVHYSNVQADAVGNASTFFDSMRRKGWYIKEFKASERPTKKNGLMMYQIRRDEAFWDFRRAMQQKELLIYSKIPYREDLRRELTAHTYQIDNMVIKIEPKEQVKKKLGRSPDIADSAVIGYYKPASQSRTVIVKSNLYGN